MPDEKRLAVELMPEVMPLLKERIKGSSIDKSDEGGDEVLAASAGVPVGFAIVAAYQFRWFVTQVCALDIPLNFRVLVFVNSFRQNLSTIS